MGTERPILLKELLDRVPQARLRGDGRVEISAIEIDSRAVEPGALFVALRGEHTDGHRFVEQALTKGAHAVVVERAPAGIRPDATVIEVPDSRRALSALSAAFHGNPSHDIDVIGITGTNGKTTTAHLVAAICDAAGIPCGILGTIGAEFGSDRWLLANTTPQPPELQAALARMRDRGAKAVAMEVSSHALALDRVDDVRFRVAALTNVARDHLDFHKTLEAYAASKRRLFSLAGSCVLNADDSNGARWAAELEAQGRRVVTYSLAHGAALIPTQVAVETERTLFTVDGRRFELQLSGRFNVYNALAAIGIARLLGIDDGLSAQGLARVARVAGRMERVTGGGVAVVVDYAHTPDALDHALSSLRETTAAGLAVVFGCGGDRDHGKRPEMGAIAARLADRIYVTNDNPRSEEPQAIVDEIVAGMGRAQYAVELDRRRAIERAVAESNRGDVVLVAGKGHESYQVIGDRVMPFDDVTVAREALAARGVLR